ncbi:hypothetical protein B0H14DRAFT_2617461 [Mycena olivaceomarginata]|nr:hypothetical protein B0H14DRAFT_2617461 [Mycena olivaceomarginata]
MIIVHSQCRFPPAARSHGLILATGVHRPVPVPVEVDNPDCGVCIPPTIGCSRSNQCYNNIVPLSAHETVQEVTYCPNDTLPSLPMSNFIPSILRTPTASFTPQVLAVRDVIFLNGSIFNCTIVKAFNGLEQNATSVTSFLYYNNPFSDCNIVDMTLHTVLERGSSTIFWEKHLDVELTVRGATTPDLSLNLSNALPGSNCLSYPNPGFYNLECFHTV